MSAALELTTAEQVRILKRVREDVSRLCASADGILQPQYRHLLGRVDALIEQADVEPAASRHGRPASR